MYNLLIFNVLKGETYTFYGFTFTFQRFIFKSWCKKIKTLVQEIKNLGARECKPWCKRRKMKG